MSLDTPGSGTVPRTFFLGGWALDLAAGSGTGVDAIHVWAYPNPGSGQSAVWVGVAGYGATRTDVGAAFGSQFTPAGYNLTVSSLGPGVYDLVVWAHSAISKQFDNYRVVRLTVQ
jgi:hypothetical protein